jgi:hypothetical protein
VTDDPKTWPLYDRRLSPSERRLARVLNERRRKLSNPRTKRIWKEATAGRALLEDKAA